MAFPPECLRAVCRRTALARSAAEPNFSPWTARRTVGFRWLVGHVTSACWLHISYHGFTVTGEEERRYRFRGVQPLQSVERFCDIFEMAKVCARCEKTVYPTELLSCLDKVRCVLLIRSVSISFRHCVEYWPTLFDCWHCRAYCEIGSICVHVAHVAPALNVVNVHQPAYPVACQSSTAK